MKKTVYLGKVIFLIVVFIFLIRILPWALGDISHDEALTLGMYCKGLDGDVPSLVSVFRNYTLANNHMLSSACYWLWLKIVPMGSSSLVLRLPSLLFAVLTLLVISVCWRPWLGKRLSATGGILMASSSIYTAFAYQIRGYSLSILLSALSVTAMLKLITTRGKKGQMLLSLTLFLQPLVMPSAVVLAPAIALVLVLVFLRQKAGFLVALRIALPGLLFAGLSSAYYLSLGTQVEIAAGNAGRVAGLFWTRWTAWGHVLLGFAAHAGILLLPLGRQLLVTGGSRSDKGMVPGNPFCNRELILILLGSILLPITGMFLFSPSGLLPFPRNTLIFLPMFTFMLLLAGREQRFLCRYPFMLLCGILLQAFLVEAYFSQRIGQLIRQGRRPLSLTMQFYRGSNEFTRIARMFKAVGLQRQTLIITQDFDLASLLWHMTALGLNTEYVHSPKTIQSGIFRRPTGNLPVLLIAQTETQAGQLSQAALLDPRRCSPLQSFGRRSLYVVK